MKLVGFGNRDPKVASSIAGRLARLDKHLTKDDRETARGAGRRHRTSARSSTASSMRSTPTSRSPQPSRGRSSEDDEAAVAATAADDARRGARSRWPSNPELRNAILEVRKSYEQTIDEVSKDEVLFAGHSDEGREKAAAMITSFREYIEENKDDIRALQVLYSRPYKERLTFAEIKELATAIERPPRQWTPEKLWHAYEMLDQSKVRGSGGRMLTDIVSLVRYTLHQDDELVPFRDQVEERFAAWLASQEQKGVTFTDGAAAVADLDEGEHRHRAGDHAGVLRVHAVRRARRHRQGRQIFGDATDTAHE